MTEENRTEQDVAEESQMTNEDTAVSEDAKPAVELASFEFGEQAVKSFPIHVSGALEYARANKYEYGPRLRDAELTWNVVSAEKMAGDMVRVRLEFIPTSGFRGDPGSEYMDIDAGGAVLARRQLSVPKENKPFMLMGITAFSVILAVVLISMLTVFKTEGGDPLYIAGRTLWIRAEEPKQQQFITYQGADTNGIIYNWAMKPEDEANNELVYVKVTLNNETSGVVNLIVDESSALLLDSNKSAYQPIDTISRAYSAEAAPRFLVPGFIPIWGTVKMNGGDQVTGMMVFELPRGSSFSELRWTASDSVTIRYD
ncbi:MAG: hypothetical protein HOK43_01675 [Chloroflexi bacterium]|jgi:hypothetical protein|nr:hypothetical protein [Chloroflexota bacterium]